MNTKAHYIFACCMSYPCQLLQCWNAACFLQVLHEQMMSPKPNMLVMWMLIALIAVTAVIFVFLGAFRARWRTIYLYHKSNPWREK